MLSTLKAFLKWEYFDLLVLSLLAPALLLLGIPISTLTLSCLSCSAAFEAVVEPYIRMAEQKRENSEAVEEEEAEEDGKAEVTNLNTPCSQSTVETEHPEVLGRDGQLTPEGESCAYLQSEESSGRLDSSHTVTSTLTVSLALPAPPAGQYLTQVFLRTLVLLHKFVWP